MSEHGWHPGTRPPWAVALEPEVAPYDHERSPAQPPPQTAPDPEPGAPEPGAPEPGAPEPGHTELGASEFGAAELGAPEPEATEAASGPPPAVPVEPSFEAARVVVAEPAHDERHGGTRWSGGGLEPYEVGDPGRAAREVVAALSENPNDPADTQVDGATVGTLVVRAASARGTSHRHSGTPRQDDYALCADPGRWLVAAVADGVSAGSLSHQAATIACRGAAALVRDALEQTDDPDTIPWDAILVALAKRIVAHGRRTLAAEAGVEGVSPTDVAREMATTLVVAAVSIEPADDGRHEGVIAALGDTSVFLLDATGGWWPITPVKNDGAAIATSATMALPYLPSQPMVAQPICVEPGDALFVMTDGVGDPLGHGDGAVGEFLATVWAQPPDMLTFGGQVGFARRSFDDDRTVVGIWAAP